MTSAAPLAIALDLDAVLGEPKWLWSRIPHPTVIMGGAVDWLDRRHCQRKNNYLPARQCQKKPACEGKGDHIALSDEQT